MASMGYKTAMFAIFFNYGMLIATYIGTLLFRDPIGAPVMDTYNGVLLRGTSFFSSFGSVDTILGLVMTAGVLALFAFSLLVPTIPFVFMFFALNGIISAIYINELIPACTPAIAGTNIIATCMGDSTTSIFSIPITMGFLVVYYIGICEFAARQKV
jgi:hypothetical protein